MVEPGLEFRSLEVLESLFRHHKLWKRMREIMSKGVSYPLETITKEALKGDLHEMLK